MIQEAYCSFEIAKLLKEKGFNEICYTCYMYDKLEHDDYPTSNSSLIEDCISAPTHQLAMRWLREVKNIHLAILHSNRDYIGGLGYWFTWNNEFGFYESDQLYKTYEEATEAALKYALEVLI